MSQQLSMFDLFNLVGENAKVQSTMELAKNTNSDVFSAKVEQVNEEVEEMFTASETTDKEPVENLFVNISAETTEEKEEEKVKDVRTEFQKNNKVSYDVGEKIWGARKDIEEIKRRFLENPDHELLNEIADLDVVVAEKLAAKENVFSWFSMKDCHKRGVNVQAAYGMYLMIRRIPTNSKGLNLSEYMKALVFISDCFKEVKTFEQFEHTFNRFETMALRDSELAYRERQAKRIQEQLEELTADEENLKENLNFILKLRDRINVIVGIEYVIKDVKQEYSLDKLGKFTELLRDSKKLRSFNNSINKYSTWEEYFEETSKKSSRKGTGQRKSVWERELPVEPQRFGGREIEEIKTPEQFKEYFGFLGIQFGHWVEDTMARAHLVNSSRAYVDLADILNIDVKHVSLGNELSMAFGARGKGRSLGHFERAYNIINLTKEKGSLGILAHEWFHAYDYYLNRVITGGEEFLLTEGQDLYKAPIEIYEAWSQLMKAIKEGKSTAYVDVSGLKGTFHLGYAFKELYESVGGDLQAFMDVRMKEFDDRVERLLSGYTNATYYEKQKAKFARKRKTELRNVAHALSQYHYEVTKELVTDIPYTVDQSQFYRNAMVLDREKEGKYWSSPQELTARVFEAYINNQLRERGWRSDYLVYGIDAIAYPVGDEAVKVFNAMQNFLDVTLPYLREEK